MQAADAVHVASSARRAAPKLQAPMRTPRGPIPPRGRTVDRYAPGGPGAERLAGIERALVRAAASARLVQSQAATVAVRGAAAVPVSAPVPAAAATCFLRLEARLAAACRLEARDAVVAPRVELLPPRCLAR